MSELKYPSLDPAPWETNKQPTINNPVIIKDKKQEKSEQSEQPEKPEQLDKPKRPEKQEESQGQHNQGEIRSKPEFQNLTPRAKIIMYGVIVLLLVAVMLIVTFVIKSV